MASSHSFLRRLIGRATSLALAVALTAPMMQALTATTAAAQDERADDIYLVAIKDDEKPIVVFVFSDPSNKHYSPIDAVALYAVPGVKADAEFNPIDGCRYTYDFNTDFGADQIVGPIYGPNSEQRIIDPVTLPSYMASQAVKLLRDKGMVDDPVKATPYFNCTGFVWSQILKLTPEAWQEIIREQYELQIKNKQ